MKSVIVFPHQLFACNPCLTSDIKKVFLIEEPLLFTQFNFHKQKLVLHRATMKNYEQTLKKRGFETVYLEAKEVGDSENLAKILVKNGTSKVSYCNVTDNWLEKRFRKCCEEQNISIQIHETPYFINTSADIERSFPQRKHYSLTDFYRKERLRLNILVTDDGKPIGDKWTFDTDNRKKLPKKIVIPKIERPVRNKFVSEAIGYVNREFPGNYGNAEDFNYPISVEEAEIWLDNFLRERLHDFGEFEDALSKDEATIFHSLLTPMLNIGLLTPTQIIDKVLSFVDENDVPMNSLEGFIRQIIGWREFMRGTYEIVGTKQRTTNFWNHKRLLPGSFWSGETGIPPLDIVIKRSLKTAYCHHIERLMVVGNFMLLTETSPDEAYKWFMEMFIDSYDWVMVGNVYSMSQYADGGLMTTKPYISGSNYLLKMSDFEKGDWCEIWDGLYWRFIAKHEQFFRGNPRLSIMSLALNKMTSERRERLMNTAENYLSLNFAQNVS
jgi:deoxyribodipyrimidine photolyase-related protein